MVLVDTSVWVDHFRRGNPRLEALLDLGEVVVHQAIIGELACGTLPDRSKILSLLRDLPQALPAGHEEAMAFIETHRLMGMGLGYVDVQILASARLTSVSLWTLDQALRKAAAKLDVLFS
jgi:predicted nucleic acid-binding protein